MDGNNITPQGIKKPLNPDFDREAELWERIVDDIVAKGAPCMETIEELVDDACGLPPQVADQPKDGDNQK